MAKDRATAEDAGSSCPPKVAESHMRCLVEAGSLAEAGSRPVVSEPEAVNCENAAPSPGLGALIPLGVPSPLCMPPGYFPACVPLLPPFGLYGLPGGYLPPYLPILPPSAAFCGGPFLGVPPMPSPIIPIIPPPLDASCPIPEDWRQFPEERYYSIDVECVASGPRHTDRMVAQISLVRGDCEVLLDLYVKPEKDVVSYITPLTGLTREYLEEHGVPLEDALAQLRRTLPVDAILVGQGIENDIRWLSLVEGQDFFAMLDLAVIWRTWNHAYQSWSVFSQAHLSKVLLGEDIRDNAHNAVDDALKAVRLFRLYRQLLKVGGLAAIEGAKVSLLTVPVTAPFKKRFPTFEGVCMGDPRACKCGAPFLYQVN